MKQMEACCIDGDRQAKKVETGGGNVKDKDIANFFFPPFVVKKVFKYRFLL